MSTYVWEGAEAEINLARLVLTYQKMAGVSPGKEYDRAFKELEQHCESPEARALLHYKILIENQEMHLGNIREHLPEELEINNLGCADKIQYQITTIPSGGVMKPKKHRGKQIDIVLNPGVKKEGVSRYCGCGFITIRKDSMLPDGEYANNTGQERHILSIVMPEAAPVTA